MDEHSLHSLHIIVSCYAPHNNSANFWMANFYYGHFSQHLFSTTKNFFVLQLSIFFPKAFFSFSLIINALCYSLSGLGTFLWFREPNVFFSVTNRHGRECQRDWTYSFRLNGNQNLVLAGSNCRKHFLNVTKFWLKMECLSKM